MRKKLLNIIAKTFRIVAFLLIVFFIINRLTPFYSHMKNEDYNYIAFKEMKEEPDVLIFGSSIAGCSISPNVMYDSYGITSYNLSARGQKPLTTKYVLEEAIKIHKPKVVIVVLDYINQDQGSLTFNENIMTTRKIGNNDLDKLMFLYNNFKGNSMEYVKYFFPLFQFHSDLVKGEMDDVENVSSNYPKRMFRKGFSREDGVESVEKVEKSTEQQELSAEYVQQMRNLIDLCNENEIGIVFVSLPNSDHGIYAQSFAKNFSDCDIIDIYDWFDSIGLNYDTDYYDDYHMNNSGAQKVSHYLSQYILMKYELEDFRKRNENNLWDITKIYCDEIGYDNYKTDSWKYYLEKYSYCQWE